jgi:hypothetical protein
MESVHPKLEYKGQGAHWSVYQYLGALDIHGTTLHNPICKINKRNSIDTLQETVKKFLKIKPVIPTLDYCFVGNLDNLDVLWCENLCDGEMIYVSPNSVRQRFSPKKQMLLDICAGQFDETKDYEYPQAETYCLKQKIASISNFSSLIEEIKNDMIAITSCNIEMCEDAFFFGRLKDCIDVEIAYKIADFDCVYEHKRPCAENVNISYGLTSLSEYIHYFVEDGVKKEAYKMRIMDEIKQYKN